MVGKYEVCILLECFLVVRCCQKRTYDQLPYYAVQKSETRNINPRYNNVL